MKSLSSRKQLLIAESDINRSRLVDEMSELTASASALTDRAKSFRWIGSAAALLWAGVAAFRRHKSVPATPGFSWRNILFKATGLASTFYLASRPWNRNGNHQKL